MRSGVRGGGVGKRERFQQRAFEGSALPANGYSPAVERPWTAFTDDRSQIPPGRKFLARRTAGLALAALVHLLLIASFAAMGAKAQGPAQGAPEGVSLSVSLVRLDSPSAASPAPASEMDALESLRQSLQTTSPAPTAEPKPASPPPSAAAILDAFDHRQPTDTKASSTASAARAGANGASASQMDDPLARASLLPAAKAPAPDGLWRQVARCWKPTAQAPVEVKVDIVLYSQCRLTRPPQLVDGRAISKSADRLASEADALSAVVACAPYASAPTSAQLDFKPGAAG